MKSQAAQLFMALMEAKEMKVALVNEEEDTILRTGFNLDNTEVSIFIVIDEGDECVHFEGRDFLKVPKDKEIAILKACNECNNSYRWVKFVLQEDDSIVSCKCDAVIQLDSCADEIFELVMRMASIVDEAYPTFMKAMWA